MNVMIVTGSRDDWAALKKPTELLKAAGEPVAELRIFGQTFDNAYKGVAQFLLDNRPDVMLMAGGHPEILAAAIAAHMQHVLFAHLKLATGDDTLQSAISCLASIVFDEHLADQVVEILREAIDDKR